MSSLFELSQDEKHTHLLSSTPVWLKLNFEYNIKMFYNQRDNIRIKYKKFMCTECLHSFPFYEEVSPYGEPCGYCDCTEFMVFNILSDNSEVQDGLYVVHCPTCYTQFEKGKFNFGNCKHCGATGAEYVRYD